MRAKLQNNFLRVSFLMCILMLGASSPPANNKQAADEAVQYRRISMEEYADKVAGGWLGQN